MAHYDDSLTLRDARRLYFEANQFGANGGYDDAWVKFKVGPFPFAFPNTPSRVRAVRFHDLHHVMTGYETTNQGEAEIGAWELGSGCADHHAAWVLNLSSLGLGVLIAPRATFRAFVRGRRSGNLYREPFAEALLDRRVGETRATLGLDRPVGKATARDVLAFAAGVAGSVVTGVPLAVAMPVLGLGSSLLGRLVAASTSPGS